MENTSLCVSPASKIMTGAFLGFCAGTLAAPKRDSLKRMLVQPPDYFDKNFNPSVISRMTDEELGALELIKDGSDNFRKSGRTQNNAIKAAAKEWHTKFNEIKVEPALELRLNNKKDFLKKAIQETGIININRRLKVVDADFLETQDNLVMRDEILELSSKKKKALSTLKFPIEEYKEALRAVRKDRMNRMKSLPNSGFAVKSLFKEMEGELAKKRTLMSNKLYELTNTPLLKESYNKIQRFLPETRIGNALKGAAILGTLTTIWLIFFNPSTRK